MSFLWGPSASQAEFDALLDKTTSDLLPSATPPDLVASLQLADMIRSTAIPPQAAAKCLVRKLKHDNPNVQLLALAVLDICIKNGGTPFLVQVASRECAQELETLGRGTPSGNRDVKDKVLSKLQDWATAFQGKDALRHTDLVRAYERMRNEGLPFPARDPTATAAMVDSLSAPEWKDAPYCTRCRTEFTTFNRKHHCRNCGDVFDQQCSSNVSPLPHYGVTEPVRVCDGCIKKIKEGKGATVRGRSTSLGSKSPTRTGVPERSATVSYSGSKSSRRKQEEDDLQRAIEASLRDAEPSSGPAFQLRTPEAPSASGYNPSYKMSSDSKSAAHAEEDDPDLAAAIAASLRDVAPAPSAPSHDGPTATYASLYGSKTQDYTLLNQYTPAPTRYSSLPSYDLSSAEASSLTEFSSTLDRPPVHPIGSREHELYEQARRAAPRLERGLEDAERRREILVEMNAKLGEATRLYQGLLEDRSRYRSPYTNQASNASQNNYPMPTPVPPQPYTTAQLSSHYQYVPPTMGQPLPFAPAPAPPTPRAQIASPVSPTAEGHRYTYHHHQQQQQYNDPHAHYAQQSAAQHSEPRHEVHQPQTQQQTQSQPQPQPTGYYKPSSFPSVPKGPEAALFPSVPHDAPWERDDARQSEQQRQEEAPVGELIEL